MSIRNLVSTARSIGASSLDATSDCDTHNTIVSLQEVLLQHDRFVAADVGPDSEATPDSSLRTYLELACVVGSQTTGTSKSGVDEPWRPKDIILPKVTISAFTETGQEESSIVVPLQRTYSGNAPVITSGLADTPCAILGVRRLLDVLNTTLGTLYSLDMPSLSSLLEDCITNDYDFGMAYGHLRRIWYTRDWSTIRDTLRKMEEKDKEMRRKALVGNRIVNPYLTPRRVWDLCSNRVVPFWSTGIPTTAVTAERRDLMLRPISHAWVDEKDRADVSTPINGYERCSILEQSMHGWTFFV